MPKGHGCQVAELGLSWNLSCALPPGPGHSSWWCQALQAGPSPPPLLCCRSSGQAAWTRDTGEAGLRVGVPWGGQWVAFTSNSETPRQEQGGR